MKGFNVTIMNLASFKIYWVTSNYVHSPIYLVLFSAFWPNRLMIPSTNRRYLTSLGTIKYNNDLLWSFREKIRAFSSQKLDDKIVYNYFVRGFIKPRVLSTNFAFKTSLAEPWMLCE